MACAKPARQKRSQSERALLVVAGNAVGSAWRRVWIRLFVCGSLVTSTELGVWIGHHCVRLPPLAGGDQENDARHRGLFQGQMPLLACPARV
jgi:hypothetical protein